MTGRETDELDGFSGDERNELRGVLDRLERAKPILRPAFRSALRARLFELERSGVGRPARFRIAVAAYSGFGALLLATAALGVAGVGPLGY